MTALLIALGGVALFVLSVVVIALKATSSITGTEDDPPGGYC